MRPFKAVAAFRFEESIKGKTNGLFVTICYWEQTKTQEKFEHRKCSPQSIAFKLNDLIKCSTQKITQMNQSALISRYCENKCI